MRRSIFLILEQSLFGATTPILVLLTGSVGGAEVVGQVSLAMVPLIFAQSWLHGSCIDAALLKPAEDSRTDFSRVSVSIGSAVCVFVVVLSFSGTQDWNWTIIWLAVGAPWACASYVLRGISVGSGRIGRASGADATWLGVTILGGISALLSGDTAWLIFGWSLGSLFSNYLLAPSAEALRPLGISETWRLLRASHKLAWEFLVAQLAGQLLLLLIALLGGVIAAGIFRLAQTLLTPLLLAMTAARNIVLPTLVEHPERIGSILVRCWWVAIGISLFMSCIFVSAREVLAPHVDTADMVLALACATPLAAVSAGSFFSMCVSVALRVEGYVGLALLCRCGEASTQLLVVAAALTLDQGVLQVCVALAATSLTWHAAWLILGWRCGKSWRREHDKGVSTRRQGKTPRMFP